LWMLPLRRCGSVLLIAEVVSSSGEGCFTRRPLHMVSQLQMLLLGIGMLWVRVLLFLLLRMGLRSE
jgi:hypothetical protein